MRHRVSERRLLLVTTRAERPRCKRPHGGIAAWSSSTVQLTETAWPSPTLRGEVITLAEASFLHAGVCRSSGPRGRADDGGVRRRPVGHHAPGHWFDHAVVRQRGQRARERRERPSRMINDLYSSLTSREQRALRWSAAATAVALWLA